MHIVSNDINFAPENFVICEFYNENICFCWCANKLVIFPYTMDNRTSVLKILTAPAPIKKIYCYSSRIFLVCFPCGVYKLSRDKEFPLLSKSAIGIGADYEEVLVPKDSFLYLNNKQNKRSKPLFQLSSDSSDSNELCIFPLNPQNSTESFRKALLGTDCNEKLCIIANEKKLYKLANTTVKLLYSCESSIIDILPIKDKGNITGLVLVTGRNEIVIVYSRDSQLFFNKTYFNTEILALCAGVSQQSKDILWITHSDGTSLYYSRKVITSDDIQHLKTENRSFIDLQFYNEELILGLTKSKKLLPLSIKNIEDTIAYDSNTLVPLHSTMLRHTDIIIDKINEKVKALQYLNSILDDEQDKLKRINLYAYGRKIHACPKILPLFTICNRSFLKIIFQDQLPRKTQIVISLMDNCQRTFYIKTIESTETVIEIPIPQDVISDSMKLVIDLAAFVDVDDPWCLIKNFIIDPIIDKKRKGRSKKDKKCFITSKIEMLRNMMVSGNIDLKKLSEIKRSVRKEMTHLI